MRSLLLIVGAIAVGACSSSYAETTGGATDAGTSAGDSGTTSPSDAGDGAIPALGCNGAVACERVAFLTNATFTGNLGGVAGADAKCQAAADASTNARVKGHAVQAWISMKLGTQTPSPSTSFVHGTSPYVLPSGAVLAQDWDELTNGTLRVTFEEDENARTVGDPQAWTATDARGAPFGDDCNAWTSTQPGLLGLFGSANVAGATWTKGYTTSCDTPRHLYCFER